MEHWEQYGNERAMVSLDYRLHSLVKQGDNASGSICLSIRPSSTRIAIKSWALSGTQNPINLSGKINSTLPQADHEYRGSKMSTSNRSTGCVSMLQG